MLEVSTQYILNRNIFDHCPILLKNLVVDWGPKPFRIVDWWLEEKECVALVEREWGSMEAYGWGAKKKLKRWSLENVGDLQNQCQRLEKEMNDLDRKEEAQALNEEEINARRESKELFWKMALQYDLLMWQKSRAKFIEGDWERPLLDGVHFNTISHGDNNMLVGYFDEAEIKEAIWDCGSSKSLWQDRYNFKFIKKFWSTLKGDIMRFMEESHTHGVFPRGSNVFFISLIRKSQSSPRIRGFSPYLHGRLHVQIIAKAIRNRL
ncbi:hypothetical protein GmHk_05G012858 [Glycine max]|nr:hypothetical protein GmHk_05G012858 [Glycine max]